MAVQTIEKTTTQEVCNGSNSSVEGQVALAQERCQAGAVALEAPATKSAQVSPARGAYVTRLLDLMGRLLISIYTRLSGPALSDRDRLKVEMQIHEDQWYNPRWHRHK